MSSFGKSLKYLLGYGPRMMNKYIRKIRTKIFKMTNIKKPLKKGMKKVETGLKSFFTLEESSKSDYRRLGNRYVSKRVYVFVILLIIVIPLGIYFYILPFAEGRLWEAKLHTSSYKLGDFTGRARILDQEGVMIFKGILENGQINGYGEVYDAEGMIYAGTLQNGAYEGDGVQYNSTLKSIQYEGTFVNNLYDGQGVYYFDDGKRYVGSFTMGLMEGEGKLYMRDYLLYEGSFKDGLYDGQGILYLEDGTIIYQGEFKKGAFEGQGLLGYNYMNRTRYEGSFSKGKFNGDGILYNENSKPIYTGAFRDDNFDYLRYRGVDINELRKAFGQEDQAILFEESFVTLYENIHMMVVCDYAAVDAPAITAKHIVITGQDQACDGVTVGRSVKGFRVVFKEDAKDYFESEGISYLLTRLKVTSEDIEAYDLYTDVNSFVVLTDRHDVILAIII